MNLLLGCPYFKTREQFMRVYSRLKFQSVDYATQIKATRGLQLEGLKCLVIDEEGFYNIATETEWDFHKIKSALDKRKGRYITDFLHEKGIERCIILCAMLGPANNYRHAIVVKHLGDNKWAFLDSAQQ